MHLGRDKSRPYKRIIMHLGRDKSRPYKRIIMPFAVSGCGATLYYSENPVNSANDQPSAVRQRVSSE